MSKKTFGGNDLSKKVEGAIKQILDKEKQKNSNVLNDLKRQIEELKKMTTELNNEFIPINKNRVNDKTIDDLQIENREIINILNKHKRENFENLYYKIVDNTFINNIRSDKLITYKKEIDYIKNNYNTRYTTLMIFFKQNNNKILNIV